MMSESLQPSSEVAPFILCEEVFDENSLPSEEEVIDYAKTIGINPQCEPHLLPIAVKGLMEPLPKGWKPCFDASVNRWYYYNKSSKISQWEHPLDSVYRNLVRRGRSEGYSSAAEDDSKGTVKEDLKSFEEVSDILSSNADKPQPPSDENMFLDKGRPPKPHQPLLFRRKQLQNGSETTSMSSIQVAKLINNTMRENILEVAESAKSEPPSEPMVVFNKERIDPTSKIKPQQLQPLRRSHTMDPVPSFTSNPSQDTPPIKGILRESSFSGLPNRNLSKPRDGLSGERVSWPSDLEDEKKRTVRFAKTKRRKSVDLTITFSDNSHSSDEEMEGLEDEEDENEDAAESGSSSSEQQKSDDNLNGRDKEAKWSRNKLHISPDSLALVNQKLNAINVNKMKEMFVNSQAALETTLCDPSDDETDNSNNLSRAPLTVKGANFAKEEKTGRFHVSKPILDPLNDDKHAFEVKAAKLTIGNGRLKQGNAELGEDSFKGLNAGEVDEIAERKTAEKLAQIEERITKELQEKIAALKQQQNEALAKATVELLSDHDQAKLSLLEEHRVKLDQTKDELGKELQDKEEELRRQHKNEINELVDRLEEERKSLIEAAKAHHELLLKSERDQLDERLEEEKEKVQADLDSKISEIKEKMLMEVEKVKANEMSDLEKMKELSQQEVERLKSHYESATKEEESNFKKEMARCEGEFNSKINLLKLEKESELNSVKTEWDDKITATALQQRASLESLMVEHDRNISTLKQQYHKEEEELKRCHAEQIEAWNARLKKLVDKEPNSLSVNRDYEKMRCEKRLLEDKYRSLKDKYLQLKTDMKLAVERKLQSRARRRKDVLGGTETERDEEKTVDQRIRNDRNQNNVILDNAVVRGEKIKSRNPRINIVGTNQMFVKEGTENDPSSDDQYTSLSLTLPTDEHRSLSVSPIKTEPDLKRKDSFRLDYFKDGQSNVLDEVRSQLKELEEIEEQIPANSQGDTYLRYPFQGPGLSTSAEVDFYRHRVIVEQEAVRAARECLLQQKRELEARQNILRTNNSSNMHQLQQQQERDLTEMEVSLHRTRALLGEKMIRLRLLGQTLNRLVDDSPSPTVQLTNLKLDSAISPGAISDECQSHAPVKPVKMHRRYPNNKSEIEARIQGLKDWLEKPPSSNIDWNQLTL